jgi:microcystin-dependent protein
VSFTKTTWVDDSAPAITATQLNRIETGIEGAFAIGVPTGGIILWSGAVNNVPTGWNLCDGSNGTPDLRNRFVVGAGQTYAVAATGGLADVTLTSSQIPAHQHAYSGTTSAGTGTTAPHTVASSFGGGGGYILGVPVAGTSFGPGDHTHAYSGTTDNNTGGGGSHTNLPPYYALAYIMKL